MYSMLNDSLIHCLFYYMYFMLAFIKISHFLNGIMRKRAQKSIVELYEMQEVLWNVRLSH